MHTETSEEDSQGQKVIIKTSASERFSLHSDCLILPLLPPLLPPILRFVIGGTKKKE